MLPGDDRVLYYLHETRTYRLTGDTYFIFQIPVLMPETLNNIVGLLYDIGRMSIRCFLPVYHLCIVIL